MPSELHWSLIRNTSSFMVRRDGICLSREPGNLVGKHCYKYSGLAHSKVIKIEGVASGIAVSRRSTKVPTNAVRGAFIKPSVIKKGASGPHRAVKIARDLEAHGYRLDLARAAQARVCALLASQQPRKVFTTKRRQSKPAKN